MRRIPAKREHKKLGVTQPARLLTPYVDEPPCSLSQCYDSIIRSHTDKLVMLEIPGASRRGDDQTHVSLWLPDCRFCLSKGQLQAIYERQQGRCALTGVQLKLGLYAEPGRDTIGLDMIRHQLGYVKSNCRLLCWPLAMGRTMAGWIPTQHARKESIYVSGGVLSWVQYDTMPHKGNLIRHSLLMLYMEHLTKFNLLKYYPIVVVMADGWIDFLAYYYPCDSRKPSNHRRDRLESTSFVKLFLDERGDLIVYRYDGDWRLAVERDRSGPPYLIDYANPELDFCEAIDRAVLSWFKIWYEGFARNRY